MSLIQVNFFSYSLMKITTFQMILPNDLSPEMTKENKHYERGMKTLYLLHGFTGNANDWMLGSQVQEMAIKYNLAIVMPSGDNSFYLDGKGTGRAYGQFVGKELVEYVRKVFGLSDKREDTFIGGLSMGGFGAIHVGLKNWDTFGGMIGLSSALIIHDIKNKPEGFINGIADYDYYVSVFGNLNELEASENNPECLIKKLKEEKKEIQDIYMACGTEDFLLQENRDFHEFLVKEKVQVDYHESSGIHDWKFWNQYLEPAIQWMLRKL